MCWLQRKWTHVVHLYLRPSVEFMIRTVSIATVSYSELRLNLRNNYQVILIPKILNSGLNINSYINLKTSYLTGTWKIKDVKSSFTTASSMLQVAIYKYPTQSTQLAENCFFKQLTIATTTSLFFLFQHIQL